MPRDSSSRGSVIAYPCGSYCQGSLMASKNTAQRASSLDLELGPA